MAHTDGIVAELRAAGHHDIATKLDATHELHSRLRQDPNTGNRAMTADERAEQVRHELSYEELGIVQTVEYSTFVAVEEIRHGNALAYGVGHPVPVSNVHQHGYEQSGLVKRVTRDADTPRDETRDSTHVREQE